MTWQLYTTLCLDFLIVSVFVYSLKDVSKYHCSCPALSCSSQAMVWGAWNWLMFLFGSSDFFEAHVLVEDLPQVPELHSLQLDPAGLLRKGLNDDSGPQIPGSQHLLTLGIQTVLQITWDTEWSQGAQKKVQHDSNQISQYERHCGTKDRPWLFIY